MKKVLLIANFLIGLTMLNGQSYFIEVADKIAEALKTEGFQSVAVKTATNSLVVSYENRIYRFEPTAIQELTELVLNQLPADLPLDTLVLVSKQLNIPIITTKLLLRDVLRTQSFFPLPKIIQSSFYQNTSKENLLNDLKNNGNYRLELVLVPELGLGLGGFPDPVLHRINLRPTANLYLWKGGQIQIQGVVPISSEFNLLGEKMFRPGFLTWGQTFRLSKSNFFKTTVGLFSNNRYGGVLEAKKYFFKGQLDLNARIGYTGYAAYPRVQGLEQAEKGWAYSDINYLDYQIGLNYFWKKYNLNVGIEYGKALLNREYIRVEVLQQFKEIDIGFFAIKNQQGSNYGMLLSIPIFPKKYWKPKRLSVRPARYFSYDYYSKPFYIQRYQTGVDLRNAYDHLRPGFLKNQW